MPHSTTDPSSSPHPTSPAASASWLTRLDHWMALNPWHPRLIPFALYGLFLLLIDIARSSIHPSTYPFLYLLQCSCVAFLLFRYRKLLPELTLSFHWLAIPTALFVFYSWVLLALITEQAPSFSAIRQQGLLSYISSFNHWLLHPTSLPPDQSFADPTAKSFFQTMSAPLAWSSLSLRLLGMSILVPMFEELWVRSLALRSFLHFRPTMIGLVQIMHDMPLIGDWLAHSDLADKAHRHPQIFSQQFNANPLGTLTLFGLFSSTLIFTLSHHPRDWPACILCSLSYCLLLAATRHKGLGPTIWAHGLTNALLWAYTLHTSDWRFL